ncbi:MAG: hypothetical protein A2583_08610 [Bdellovibrionales bacterium RIFOXYD1_FULL_53_11]|nr:MAG: hypothetical protein A2583_08610 [Bdellovibrionales bacterium RIFOXYD1_FULL_53_11]
MNMKEIYTKNRHILRDVMVLAGCIAIAMAVARCSPRAQNVSKYPQKSKDGAQTASFSQGSLIPSIEASTLSVYETLVVSADAVDGALPWMREGMTSYALTDLEIAELVKTGSVRLPVGTGAADRGFSVIGMKLTRSEIEAEKYNLFKTTIKKHDDRTVILSVPAGSDERTWQSISQHMTGITVFLKGAAVKEAPARKSKKERLEIELPHAPVKTRAAGTTA